MEWYTLAKSFGLNFFESKIIVHYVLLYGHTAKNILDYFRTVLDFLKHPCATLKLKSSNGFKKGVSL